MTDLIKVSVIVPVYNAADTLTECINSLIKLSYPSSDAELIFVNNASTDKTANILSRFGDRIRVLYEAKRGAAASRNTGVRNARGQFVAFTDADCVVEKDWLTNLILPLEDDSVGIVGGKILAKTPCNSVEKFAESIHDHHAAINVYRPPYVITMNWASRLSLLRENLFDEAFIRAQDVDLSYRIFQLGYRFVFAPTAVIYHRNEATLRGLFDEGFTHGFHSVRVKKKHQTFLQSFSRRQVGFGAYRELASSLRDCFANKDRKRAWPSFVFNLGKRIGEANGSVRFMYLDL